MTELCSPKDEIELALIKGILEAEGINYFVRNDYFGSMRIGPQIELLNKKMVLVHDEQYEIAKELLDSYLEGENRISNEHPEYSFIEKVRMIVEYLLFGWFMPGNKRKSYKD